jgi:hypothetical protein
MFLAAARCARPSAVGVLGRRCMNTGATHEAALTFTANDAVEKVSYIFDISRHDCHLPDFHRMQLNATKFDNTYRVAS